MPKKRKKAESSKTLLTRHEILAPIGMGGMASIYLARIAGPAGFEKHVALKVIHKHLAAEPTFLEMFRNEAKIAAQLNHPNIVQTNELGEEGGIYFISMEYLKGESSSEIIKKIDKTPDRRMDIRMACHVIMQACEGLHHAHHTTDTLGRPLVFVHRDICPHNIFVTYSGGVKIMDFGVARAEHIGRATKPGSLKGKFAYMSPEQASGKDVDYRIDIFSMGIVLWELLACRRLFRGESDFDSLRLVSRAEIPPLSELRADIPERLEKIVKKALARDREDRFQSAMELNRALAPIVDALGGSVTTHELATWMEEMFPHGEEEKRALLLGSMSVEELLDRANQSFAAHGREPTRKVKLPEKIPLQESDLLVRDWESDLPEAAALSKDEDGSPEADVSHADSGKSSKTSSSRSTPLDSEADSLHGLPDLDFGDIDLQIGVAKGPDRKQPTSRTNANEGANQKEEASSSKDETAAEEKDERKEEASSSKEEEAEQKEEARASFVPPPPSVLMGRQKKRQTKRDELARGAPKKTAPLRKRDESHEDAATASPASSAKPPPPPVGSRKQKSKPTLPTREAEAAVGVDKPESEGKGPRLIEDTIELTPDDVIPLLDEEPKEAVDESVGADSDEDVEGDLDADDDRDRGEDIDGDSAPDESYSGDEYDDLVMVPVSGRPKALYVVIGAVAVIVVAAFVAMKGGDTERADTVGSVGTTVRASAAATGSNEDAGSATGSGASTETQSATGRVDEGDATPAAVEAGDSEVSGEVERTNVLLTGLPDGAEITLDEEPVSGGSVRVPRDGERHRISIRAPGFDDWRRDVVGNEDTEIAVNMEPVVRVEPDTEEGRAKTPSPSGHRRRPTSKARNIYRNPGF